jgi:hypothetical protein
VTTCIVSVSSFTQKAALLLTILAEWKKYKEETWELKEKFLKTEALAQFERKFDTGDKVSEEDSGPITGPKPRR